MPTGRPLPLRPLLTTCALLAACGSGQVGGGRGHDPVVPPAPPAACTPPAGLADTSTPDRVVGSGTPASCTPAALAAALAAGGTITFACGAAPVAIALGAELQVVKDTVLDGGGLVTLDGQDTTRILAVRSSFERLAPHLTVQRLTLVRGRGTGALTEGGGGAIYRLGGGLTVLDSTFLDNAGPAAGQDVAGGAISSIGVGPTVIVGSRFARNRCSNGGALGNLGNPLTLVDSIVTGNAASGAGGNPGNGGNGGGISVDGQGNAVSLCGVTLSGNAANAYGGTFFRVGYGGEATSFDRCTVDSNAIPDRAPSLAGGLYLQGVAARLTATTLSRNAASGGGGAFIGPGATLQALNVTIADNTALSGLGGGLFLSSETITGTLRNVTLVRNRAPGPVAFGGAIAGGGPGLVLASSIVTASEAGNAYNPVSCTRALGDGGGNVQWPDRRAGGASDTGSPCAPGILFADPLVGALRSQGGPTETAAPAAGSPAIGRGTSCPATDQRGLARAAACTCGAVEVGP
jgi:hypothetical protein